MIDNLGDRMKDYENRTRYLLPRRQYILLRLDGKAFHTYCRGMEKPFDLNFVEAMNETAKALCANNIFSGIEFAYIQSDEITILLTDFKRTKTQAAFDYNLQKLVSISASITAANFLYYRMQTLGDERIAGFDSRAWPLADPFEVENNFI